IIRSDNRVIDVSISTFSGNGKDGNSKETDIFLLEKSSARQNAKNLAYKASHDVLTGLYNKREFEAHIVAALDDVKKNDSKHIVCVINFDKFSVVNDKCGHAAGDEFLKKITKTLQDRIRNTDILSRFDGDKLGLMLSYCSTEQAQNISNEIIQIINNFSFKWKDNILKVSVSIGISIITKESNSLEEILCSAESACLSAKEYGRNRFHIYHKDDADLEMRKSEMEWINRLAKALDENRFEIYLQPIKKISREDESGSINKYEVLLRLKENDCVISPDDFIGAAEKYGLMPSIDRWVIKQAVLEISQVLSHINKYDCMFSINLSGQSLCDIGLFEFIIEELKNNNIPSRMLCFEITETAAIENIDQAKLFINNLKDIGCKFSLDDFGSGLSSFSYLKNLNVDFLKIDGSFIKSMNNDVVDQSMVKAINDIGQVMGIETIAEYVENNEIYDLLNKLGINYAQGYYVSEALPFKICIFKYSSTNSGRKK
ncbi:MAG: EAL domain-containing protein, partial [Methylococcales bacterium]